MGTQKRYDKEFFKQWSSDMAYVLGFLYADGNIVVSKRGNHYVALYTADRSILLAMRVCMKSEHAVSARFSKTGCVYRIQVGSKEWFDDLSDLGLVPNKVTRMRLPRVPHTFFGDFVRGYFDGDGNVWIGEIHKKRKTSHVTLQVMFTSGCYEFLDGLLIALRDRGLRGGSLYRLRAGNYSRLAFSSIDALKLAEIMYNGRPKLFLKRKKLRFDEFKRLRP
jgi:hypothetical protein